MNQEVTQQLQLPMKKHAELKALAVANKLMAAADMDGAQQAAVRTAIIEAIINATEHSHAANQKVNIEFRVTSKTFKITISDNGKGFDISQITPVNFREKRKKKETRGWGLHMIRQAMDKVEIHSGESGTTLIMIKNLKEE